MPGCNGLNRSASATPIAEPIDRPSVIALRSTYRPTGMFVLPGATILVRARISLSD
jgi:hypothetical protein